MRLLAWLITALFLSACGKQEPPPPAQAYTPPAQAKWEKLGETDDTVEYFDHASIQKDGQLRRIWLLTNLKKRQATGEKSWLTYYEYDCDKARSRGLWMSGHAEPMAGGTIVFAGNPPSEWSASDLLKFSCAA